MTFPHEISLIFLRWTGICPVKITSNNDIKRSLFWQLWSLLVSTLTIVILIMRFYVFLKLKDKMSVDFVLQTIRDIEPLFSIILVTNIAWTNCFTSNIEQQVKLLKQLLERPIKERQNTRKWDIWFLVCCLLTLQILIIIVLTHIFFTIKDLNFIQIQNKVWTLSLSCFVMFQRIKFCFLLKLIQIESKHIKIKLQSCQPKDFQNIIDTFNKLLSSWQLFEKIFRPTTRSFLTCTSFMFVTGCKAVQDLLMTIIYDNVLNIRTLIMSYWFIQSVPMLIWIIHTGESVQTEVSFNFFLVSNYCGFHISIIDRTNKIVHCTTRCRTKTEKILSSSNSVAIFTEV